MFTPPPSPLPPLKFSPSRDPPMLSLSPSSPPSPKRSLYQVPTLSQPPLKSGTRTRSAETSMLAIQDRKRQIAWRTRLTVIILPLLLTLATLVTRFSSRSLYLDSLAGPSPRTRVNFAVGKARAGHSAHVLHRRQKEPPSTSSAAGLDFPSQTPSSSPPPSGTVPTIPSSPPALPTPFPQPFETLASNFTTDSCTTFFLNMTQTLPFRQCRPFSFLSQASTSFLQVSVTIFFPLRAIHLN